MKPACESLDFRFGSAPFGNLASREMNYFRFLTNGIVKIHG
jgi:hypothetical protein